MSFVSGIIGYKGGFATTERKDFNSSAELTSDGWQNTTASHGYMSVSGGYMVCGDGSNDSTPVLVRTLPSKLSGFEFSCEVYIQPSSWGGLQAFGACGGDFSAWAWFPTDRVGFEAQATTSGGYTAASTITVGTDGTYQWVANGAQPNGTYVFRIKFDGSLYTCTVENTGGTILHTRTYSSTRQVQTFYLEIRYGFTSENYNKVNWLELRY